MIKIEHRIPVLIPVFNNVDYTKKAVASLLKCTNPDAFECIIIDNGSTDETPEYLKQLVKSRPNQFRSIRLARNLGFGGGLNQGLEAIKSFKWEFAVIANNDLVFTPNWLEQMLSVITSAPIPKLGLVGPMSNFAGGTQGMAANYKTIEDLDKFAEAHSKLNSGQYHEAGVVVGLLMLFKREFFDDVGLFDERFFPGTWEENDWELRGALKGWRYAVDRGTFIHHFGSKTLQTTDESKDQRKNFTTNRARFRDKWAGPDSPWEVLSAERYALRGMNPEEHKKANGTLKKWVVGACRVKNGAEWMERTLTRESQFADEIVILIDQASTDNTEEICAKFPKVVAIEKEPPHEYDESYSRNRVLQMAFDRHPDWVHCFDADEIIEKAAVERREELTDPADPAIMLWVQPIIQLWNTEKTRRVDGLWGNFYQGRMFRAIPGQKIHNANNKMHSGSHPTVPPDRVGFSYLQIYHYGNVDPKVRDTKYDWYTKTDADKDLNMALGGHKDHYWRLYYGNPNQQEFQSFTGAWKTIPDDPEWKRPPYGCFYSRDVYRHVKDETGLVLVPADEDHRISLCMLIKNEGGLLPRAVVSVRQFINELIVIDTGSTDGGDCVAEQLGAKVYPFKWTDNFSDARNFSLSKATGDWILRLDPDETMPWETASRLPELVRQKDLEGYVFPITNWLQDPGKVQNAQWALSETCRLYNNLYPSVHYRNPVHEELDDSFKEYTNTRISALIKKGLTPEKANEQGKMKIAKVDFRIDHFGYLRDAEFVNKKFKYYYDLNQKQIDENPNDYRPYFSRAVHELHIGRYSAAIESYKKALELDPENFMAMNDVGVLLSSVLGSLGEAEVWFRKALEIVKSKPSTHPKHRERIEKNLEEIKLKLMSKLLTV